MPHLLESATITYLTNIRNQRKVAGTTDELSYRDYLGNFLRSAANLLGKECDFTGEAKAQSFGRPDYRVTSGLKEIGYIEAEKLAVTFAKLSDSAKKQNQRFRDNLHNFLFTDHLQFIAFVDGHQTASCQLPNPPENGTISVSETALKELQTLLEAFLSESTPAAVTAEAIARQLARRARFLCDAADAILSHAENELSPIYNAYRETLFADITPSDFADIYAQTFTYGLFLAWYNHASALPFTRQTALFELPKTVPAVRVLLLSEAGIEPPESFQWILDGICADLTAADREGVLKPFHEGRDPIFHFYETFLAAYDPKLRETRGVYYTPLAVVQFIVRAVHQLLQDPDTFQIEDGIADTSVTLLDPATGTGTFLMQAYKLVYETLQEKGDGGVWPTRATNHLAKNFYGIELLPSAYTIAHIKLRQYLNQNGANLPKATRLPIFLASSLDDSIISPRDLPVVKELTEEKNEAARVVGQTDILVVLGNPPYSANSANPSRRKDGSLTFIGRLVQDYFSVDGRLLGEKNPKMLQDDYVKFIRFAENIIARRGEGILAFITNNGYLDNPTFRGMRRHLMNSFDRLYLLDLHGNAKKKERAPDGTPDQNVFDIQQGVAICLLVKHPSLQPKEGETTEKTVGKIFHADLFGMREIKYQILGSSGIKDIGWQPLQPTAPFYLFTPQDVRYKQEYDEFWSVANIFKTFTLGFKTHRDHFSIAFDQETLRQRLEDFRLASTVLSDDEISNRYQLDESSDWNVSAARHNVRKVTDWQSLISKCLYRPFDMRYAYFSDALMDRPRQPLIHNVINHPNLTLVTSRQGQAIGDGEWQVVSCSRLPADTNLFRRGANQIYPLWHYPTKEEAAMGIEREANFAPEFLKAFRDALKLPSPDTAINPEDIFYYMYAVLHAPTYRTRYAPFLKIDFPRIPLPPDQETFKALVVLGENLVKLHLLESPALKKHGISYPVPGDNTVAKMRAERRYLPPTPDGKPGRVYINDQQFFENVPEISWNFHVGGYIPAQKWLDDRTGRTLSEEDITHYRKMIAAMRDTTTLLPQIDTAFLNLLARRDYKDFRLADVGQLSSEEAEQNEEELHDLLRSLGAES